MHFTGGNIGKMESEVAGREPMSYFGATGGGGLAADVDTDLCTRREVMPEGLQYWPPLGREGD